MTSYLIFTDLPSAQTRSHTQAIAKGCIGDTDYWWSQLQNATTNQGALIFEDSVRLTGDDFTTNGLTSQELPQVIPRASMDPSWFPDEG